MASHTNNPNGTSTKSLQELHKEVSTELSTLGRVSHRLAMTNAGPQLQKVLNLLLPRLLRRIGSNHANTMALIKDKQEKALNEYEVSIKGLYNAIHAKLVEMMSHIIKRVRADSSCQLPCQAILEILCETPNANSNSNAESTGNALPVAIDPTTINPFTLNLSLTFLTIGISRCTVDELECALPSLLAILGAHSSLSSLSSASRKNQSYQVAHLVLRAMEGIVVGSRGKRKLSSQSSSRSTVSASSLLAGTKVNLTEMREDEDGNGDVLSPLQMARRLCANDATISAALYDLLLDALLYQNSNTNMNSNLPPPGLSQSGTERLANGNSVTERNWKAEHAIGTRLKDMKISLLDILAPSRRFDIFNVSGGGGNGISTARAVALLIIGSGDSHRDVADRAASYLKAHLESMKNVIVNSGSKKRQHSAILNTSANGNGNGTVDVTMQGAEFNEAEDVMVDPVDPVHALHGNPIAISCELLTLILGDMIGGNAIDAIKKVDTPGNSSDFITRLGRCFDNTTTGAFKAEIMSTKRRMVSEQNATSIMTFIMGKILDDMPGIFIPARQAQQNTNTAFYLDGCGRRATTVGTLVLMAASKYAGVGNLSGLSITSFVGNPSIAAVQLLNSYCVRLVALYDAMTNSSQGMVSDIVLTQARKLLAKSFANSCSIVSIASTANSGDVHGKIGIEARDSCYGILSTIARSSAVMSVDNFIFNCGTIVNGGDLAITTTKMLFGCVCNEAETLRPRAIAALDSLLSAYCKLYHQRVEDDDSPIGEVVPSSNPWAVVEDTSKMSLGAGNKFVTLGITLLPLLWNYAHPSLPKGSRHAAAQWTTSLLKSIDLCAACHLLCYVAGDKDGTCAKIASDGLGLGSQIGGDVVVGNGMSTIGHGVPDFNQFIETVFTDRTDGQAKTYCPMYNDFSSRGKATAVRFGLVCLLSDLYGGDDERLIAKLQLSICETLLDVSEYTGSGSSKNAPEKIELLDECAICLSSLLQASKFARQFIISPSSSSPLNISELASASMNVSSSKARRYLAKACLSIFEHDDENVDDGAFDISKWIQSNFINDILKNCTIAMKEMTSVSFAPAKIHGAAYLGASCVRALRLRTVRENDSSELVVSCYTDATEFITLLGRGILHTDEVIGQACAGGLRISFSYQADREDAPALCSMLCSGASKCLGFASIALKRFGHGDKTNAVRATLLTQAAGSLLAASTLHEAKDSNIGTKRLECVDALFALLGATAHRKDPHLSLAVGEALAAYADAYSPDGCQWTYPDGYPSMPEEFDESYARELPPHAQVVYTMLHREVIANNPHKRLACAPALLALVGRAAWKCNTLPASVKRRAFVKAIHDKISEIQRSFLVLLADPKIKQLGRESCQLGLAACYGLSAAFDDQDTQLSPASDGQDQDTRTDGTNVLNEQLLRAFGQTQSHGGSAMMETRNQQQARLGESSTGTSNVSDDVNVNERLTEVGGVDGLGEAALGAFREMASAAVILNRSDILYSLMLLSVSLPVWKNSIHYNASSLLGKAIDGSSGNIEEIRMALRPHMKQLIPRLLRACNDPNQQTRDQMTDLWIKLTGGGADSRALIHTHFLHTIDTLMDDASNKLWRARVGSCSALAEVVVGRSWYDLGGGEPLEVGESVPKYSNCAAARLLKLFRVVVRSLDDVRINVREAGEMLGRSVRSLTTRLCDPSLDGDSSSDDSDDPYASNYSSVAIKEKLVTSASASTTVLPWLVQIGLNQNCQEASGFSVSCLLSIVEVSRAETLQPVLPELIGSLIMCMSGLEPAVLNKLQVRVAGRDASINNNGNSNGYDNLERLRLQMAQSTPIAEALSKCLDMLKNADVKYQKAVIPQLDSALRCGAGFATRAAAADAVSSLCAMSPAAFKFTGSSTSNPTVRLLRALYYASERERGAGARDKMTHAFGNLAALAPPTSVRSLAIRLCERYNNASGGTNDDPSARRAVASALRAIAVRASNQFGDGGGKNVWIKYVLPLAFISRHDDCKEVASRFVEIWEEGGQAARLSESVSFGIPLQEAILPYLTKALVQSLEDVSWARRRIACASLIELVDTNILGPAPRAVDDNAMASSELITRSKTRSQSSYYILNACIQLIINTRVWTGKSELVKTVAKIVGTWAQHGASIGVREDRLFGFEVSEESEDRCPWVPVKIFNTMDDLFENDKWFMRGSESELQDEEAMDIASNASMGPDVTMETDIIEDETDIDFDEGDDMLDVNENVENMIANGNGNGKTGSDHLREEIKSLMFSGLCKLLLQQGLPGSSDDDNKFFENDHLSYRAACVGSLSSILDTVPSDVFNQEVQYIFKMVAPVLVSMLEGQATDEHKVPPLIIAKCFDCMSSVLFLGIDDTCFNELMEVKDLNQLFLDNCGLKQSAWTVREATGKAVAKFITNVSPRVIKKMDFIENSVKCTQLCLKDKKFWKVRLAGLRILLALCVRTSPKQTTRNMGMGKASLERSESEKERQIITESILPYKEQILAIARSSLSDNEAQVTKVASEILSEIAWWP